MGIANMHLSNVLTFQDTRAPATDDDREALRRGYAAACIGKWHLGHSAAPPRPRPTTTTASAANDATAFDAQEDGRDHRAPVEQN
jgi:hypothetical protein